MSDERTIRIRELNDELRRKGHALNGRIVAMGGLSNDDQAKQIRVAIAAGQHSDWNSGDDPYGEHDFGKFELDGEAHGSEHPEDPAVTIRVMTLMYAEDY